MNGARRGAVEVPQVFDPRLYADGIPHEAFRRLRAHHPVAWQDEPPLLGWPGGSGFWAVTRHRDVSRVLKEATLFSSHLGATQIRDPDPGDLPFIRRMMLNQDPPEHARLRLLVSAAFAPSRMERFAATARARAGALLDGARAAARDGDGAVDVVAAVTDEYALLNLADLLGVPPEDRGLLLHWTRQVIGYQDPDEAPTEPVLDADGRPVNPRSPEQLAEMFAYARELARHKLRRPGDDVMTALAQAHAARSGEGVRLGDAELEMFFFLLTVAGNDTVRSAAPGGLLALAEHPDAYRALRAGAVPLGTAVEELLRWHPPVLSFRRTAARDTELAGVKIGAGEKVVVFHASANFDEDVFPEPHRLDLARNPDPHLSFGTGPHRCLGARFAQIQLAALYAETARRLPALELAGRPRRLVSNFINGIKTLPLALGVDGQSPQRKDPTASAPSAKREPGGFGLSRSS
ncbi:cytochrome P450 [Streptacidiphilus jiangxiensis]|uniref:Cytochrome P450 n=1 Tax=Streptacidiphilus jiangxiensis TaxID=235985 RepID=A0A1H7ID04_STRJI|nr:cytochrome P450 [Streptacidiphilus jiangxiensis]SEK59617.1 Cytochrome P450 [Streptacidiphilus jiangxiensis]